LPKLNTEQLMERLERRIHQLELGEEIAAKDIKALLSAEQQQQLVDVSVFKWFETDGLISQRRDWLIGFKV